MFVDITEGGVGGREKQYVATIVLFVFGLICVIEQKAAFIERAHVILM